MKSILSLLLFLTVVSGYAQTSAFTYQGRLSDGNAVANGNYDLQFVLYDAAVAGSPGGALTNAPVGVTNGMFTVTLDFGAGVFNGANRWLEIGVRTNGSSAAYTALTPRQAVTSTPYAIRALSAASAATAGSASTANSVPASGITGTLATSQIPTLDAAKITSGTFTTAQIPNLDAARITSGTFQATLIPNLDATKVTTGRFGDERLSTNVALLMVPNSSATATATPIINSGFITGANVTSGGSGYVEAPTVTVNDSTGSGAILAANVSGGSVVSLTVQNAGSGYSGGTTLTMSPPPSNARQVFSSVNIFNGVNTFTNADNEFTGSFIGKGAGLTLISANNLSGVLPDERLSGNVALLNGSPNFSGAVSGSSFSGSGANLTALNASQLSSGTVPAAALSNAWQIRGNSGTTPGVHFVGTTDNQALEFKVNGNRALRIVPNNNAAHIIGGHSGNYIASGVSVEGSSIGGGGLGFSPNSIFTGFSTIGGGLGNTIQSNAPNSSIDGGQQNTIQYGAHLSAIGGGYGNTIQTNASFSTIGGGNGNTIQTNADNATIGGGTGNTIETNAAYSMIGGGYFNTIRTNSGSSSIAGGWQNTIQGNAETSTIGGGNGNSIQTSSTSSAIGGGYGNTIQVSSSSSTIGGGAYNTIQTNSSQSTIGGGGGNTIQTNSGASTIAGGSSHMIQPTANLSTIGGGYLNTILRDGQYGTIPGGRENQAASDAFAAGYRARATNSGSFVWGGDGSGTITASDAPDSVTMRARGGFRFFTSSGGVGASLAPSATSWSVISDRNAKKNFQPVDGIQVLEKLKQVPVQRWNYKWETDSDVPHIGPVAQEFKAAFFPGRDDKSITTLEFDGIELAAIQALHQIATEKEAKISALEKKNGELEKRLNQLERLVNGLTK